MNPTNSDTNPYAAFIGIDWAYQAHAIALYDPSTERTQQLSIASNPAAVDDWARALEKRFCGKPVALCVELSRGALIDQLAQFTFIHIYPLNPVTSARFRKAFNPSGAKDDPSDARRHLTILRHHREDLRLWTQGKPEDRRLQLLNEYRRKLVSLQVDLRNRLCAVLRDYYPLALEVAATDLASPMACAFLLKWPDLARLQGAQTDTIRKFYYAKGCRRGDTIEKRLKAIKEAKPVSNDASLNEPCALYMQTLTKQLVALQGGIDDIDASLAQAFADHPDHALWNSFPGAGKVVGPRLASAWTSDRNRFPMANDMQVYSGIAPVRSASGKRERVFRRYHRPVFLHQTFWEHAKHSAQYSPWAKAYIKEQVKRGVRRSTAYRSLAFKWQRIMHACWQNGTPYDEVRYGASLTKSGSPYLPPQESAA